MRLGGFVIHGDSAGTLGACLDSLLRVCDEVVAVDSCSTDGSARLVQERGIRSIIHPWQGYGAARAAGAAALAGCDWLFFLDSDEYLLDASAERLRAWKESCPTGAYVRLPIRDWAELGDRRFVFRTERHVRLIRRDAAAWQPRMVVHEAMPRAEALFLDAPIEHRFATSLDARRQKNDRYALLWALRAYLEGKQSKAVWPQRLAHTFRNAVLKGAVFRGGLAGLRLSWMAASYHARKYEFLRAVQHGEHQGALAALREGRYSDLFALSPPQAVDGVASPSSFAGTQPGGERG